MGHFISLYYVPLKQNDHIYIYWHPTLHKLELCINNDFGAFVVVNFISRGKQNII